MVYSGIWLQRDLSPLCGEGIVVVALIFTWQCNRERIDGSQGQTDPQGTGPSDLCLPDRPHFLQVLQPSKSSYKPRAEHLQHASGHSKRYGSLGLLATL